ncbi:MAG: lytic transglycosylase domain-containing protein [Bdellovibrionales bacterium]|nr:lytic transglycosylase domain-containing protein [Bdellovibrionales bacterium]
MFYLGLSQYRLKNYSSAASYFEKYLTAGFQNSIEESYRLKSMYWLWRSQQKLSLPTAEKMANQIIEEFPLTYYGLRAKIELTPNDPIIKPWSGDASKIKKWMTPRENKIWSKIKILLRAGWFFEAQEELKQFQDPASSDENILYAKWSFLAFDHYDATLFVRSAWNLNKEYLSEPFVRLVYPVEFKNSVTKEAEKRGIEDNLIYSLIKQESSFRVKAVSEAKAVGLMQIVSITAKDVQRDLKLKNINFPEDLNDPQTNVMFGTYYLKKMMRAHDGNVPFALAAYNAGIGNMRRWTKVREEFKDFGKFRSTNPDDELWIDELPWEETSHYVKAILRNLILYQWFDNKFAGLGQERPFWEFKK